MFICKKSLDKYKFCQQAVVLAKNYPESVNLRLKPALMFEVGKELEMAGLLATQS
jgi:hypothetical protein